MKLVQALRFNIRHFGIPLEEGGANLYCDNEAVNKNVVYPESVLKKKHRSVAYHRCREALASGMVRAAKEDT